jgi:Tol biopolymer transport system component
MRMSLIALSLLLSCSPRAAESRSEAALDTGPQLFGAGLFSTSAWDFFIAFSPDQKWALFCRANDDFTAYDIYQTQRGSDGRWSAPAKPAFAREWSNADPHLSLDGRTVFFISNRPWPGDRTAHDTYDIWTATVGPDGGWSEAAPLPRSISLPHSDEWSPSVAANGDLYFGSERPGTRGGLDLWVARRAADGYAAPENLGDSINTAGHEVEPWIAPDQSYLIFSARGRSDSVGGYDLYSSRRIKGVWQRAVLLQHGVSSPALDFNQSVSPDGRWLYWSSTRGNGTGDIYRISMRELGLGSETQTP